MYSDNVRQHQQNGWQCNGYKPTGSDLGVDNQSSYLAQPKENLLIQIDNVQVINEKERNSVSSK